MGRRPVPPRQPRHRPLRLAQGRLWHPVGRSGGRRLHGAGGGLLENPLMLSNQELPTQDLCGLMADLLLKKQWKLATAESCTGGLISAACTDLAGSSAWFERGFVTYSNDAKVELLGVEERT